MPTSQKTQRGYIYFTDGTTIRVKPISKYKFDYTELQKAVEGYFQSLRAANPRCKQMFCNEESLMNPDRFPPNPHTQKVCNMKVYNANGYGPSWRVLGNIIAIISEDRDGAVLPTIAVAMAMTTAERKELEADQKVRTLEPA
jgi:hypothetical protein